MYQRLLSPPKNKSFFLFGPRGTGKTTWLKNSFPNASYIDMLEAEIFNDLLANPQRLKKFILQPHPNNWIIIDEVQRVPELLNEVHRLIENEHLKFILTGSSARKLKKYKEVNLLAGRALTYHMYPLTTLELGSDFNLYHALKFGHLPATFQEPDPKKYLESYVQTYLEEEVKQEGLTRHLNSFSRFLEAASFSQSQILNMSEVSRECAVHRKIVENYFSILEDLMIAYRLPVFTKKAKRRMIGHDKFYFFDSGVYQTLRPKGPLDEPASITGPALETLIFQQIKAINEYLTLDYDLFYYRTASGIEVDFILYGERGIIALEIKSQTNISSKHLKGLRTFLTDYPEAKAYFIYGGERIFKEKEITCIPVETFLNNISQYLK